MRTEPGEQPSKCKRLCCSLTSMSWEAAQSRPLSTQPTRQLLPLPREATSCCKGPRVFPGWGPNLLKWQLWRSIPCSQRGAGSLGAFQSPSCSEAPCVRKGHGAPSAGRGCARRETAPFLLEVRARPLLAFLVFPAMLKVMTPQMEGLSVLWSIQAISLHDRS